MKIKAAGTLAMVVKASVDFMLCAMRAHMWRVISMSSASAVSSGASSNPRSG